MKRTTTRNKITPRLREIKELMSGEEDFLRPLVGLVVQEVLEAEMSEALGAQKGERTERPRRRPFPAARFLPFSNRDMAAND